VAVTRDPMRTFLGFLAVYFDSLTARDIFGGACSTEPRDGAHMIDGSRIPYGPSI
jgi:hypothetical protein